MNKRLLWVDDDEDRFAYERLRLTESGWHTDWAATIEGAVALLCAHPYNVIVLDQMVPSVDVTDKSPLFVWAGCRLLWWIRRRADWRPVAGETPEAWAVLAQASPPVAANVRAPVLIVSGIYDASVFDRMRSASGVDTELAFLPKPLEPEVLLRVADSKLRQPAPP